MLNIKHCTELSASLLLLSSIAFATQTQAQTIDVPFNGTIANTCAFVGPAIAGTLVKSGALAAVEGSADVDGFSTGNAGQVSVNCPNGGSLIVAAPTPVVPPPSGFNAPVVQSVVQLIDGYVDPGDFTSAHNGSPFGTGSWNQPTNAPLALPAGISNLNVAMIAGANTEGAIPGGYYSYNVTLTVTPN